MTMPLNSANNDQTAMLARLRQMDPAVHKFVLHDENTTRQEVVLSVQDSLVNLLQRYPDLDVPAIVIEIDAWLAALESLHKNLALQCVKRLKRHTEHYHTVTLPHLLALVWVGIHDTHFIKSPDALLLTFLNNLTKAEMEFEKNSTDCFIGAFHQVIETLDRTPHPDVLIETVHISHDRMAALAINWGKQRVIDILLQRNIKQQDVILASWSDVSEKSLAQKFLHVAIDKVKHDLQKEFKTLLPASILAELAETLMDLPKPNVIRRRHAQVITEIHALDTAFSIANRIELVNKLKLQAQPSKDPEQQLFLDQAYQALISVDISAGNFTWQLKDYAAQDVARLETLDYVKKLFNCTYAKMARQPLADIPKIMKEFYMIANTLKADVEKHHHTYGASSWLGIFQPASKVATALQHAFNDNPTRALIC
jgi:hypothetical protein